MRWEKVKLGDCCEITSSKRIFYSEYAAFGIPFYRSKEIIERSQGKSISEPLYITNQTIFYKGIMPSEKILDLPVDCNFLTGSVNL